MEKLGKTAMISDGERGPNSWACPPNGKGRSVNIFNSFILGSRVGADRANFAFDVSRFAYVEGILKNLYILKALPIFIGYV
jgi:hypothetical protein